MTKELWAKVDEYFEEHFMPPDAALDAAVASSKAAELPAIAVSPALGKLLHLFARLMNANRILEIGTLGGYSTIWLARALGEHGRLISLEFNPMHAEVATRNIEQAGLLDKVEVRVGRAVDLLPVLEKEDAGPFDMIFVDADKQSIPQYFEWALRLSRKGSLIIVDNVVRNGAVIEAENADVNIQGVRRFVDMVANEPRVSATGIQCVGVKGYDGFAFLMVN